MHQRFHQPAAVFALLAALLIAPIHAQTCPFDDGGSSLEVERLILTRYALGLTSEPLVANTSVNAVDGTVTCTTPATGGGGTVTSITAGTGLTGGTITGSGTVAVNTVVIQSRVTATRAAGSTIRAIAAGGTVTGQTDTTDGSGTVTSVATGAGLIGGPISTTGTIGLTANQLLPTPLALPSKSPNGTAAHGSARRTMRVRRTPLCRAVTLFNP